MGVVASTSCTSTPSNDWLTQDQLQNSPHLFYRVVLGDKSAPLEWITMPVTFRNTSNYHNEMLAFEVVDFSGPYNVILG
jgi:hypothetical protein